MTTAVEKRVVSRTLELQLPEFFRIRTPTVQDRGVLGSA